MTKIAVIRFSSFGDVVQSLATAPNLKRAFPAGELHWITKKEYAPLAKHCPDIDRVWSFDASKGVFGLTQLANQLRKENFTHLYDAHQHLRSISLTKMLRLGRNINFLYRSKDRIKRFLLFRMGKNQFPQPFKGMHSYLEPLRPWNISTEFRTQHWSLTFPNFKLPEHYILVAPSTAWPLKTWPLRHWHELIAQAPDLPFVLVGGKDDPFCRALADQFKSVTCLAGQTSFLQTAALVQHAKTVIAADTGVVHLADLFGTKAIGLYGPTAFGFPSGNSVKVLEAPLDCRPCTKDGRGRCHQSVYQQCMVDIAPRDVLAELSASQ